MSSDDENAPEINYTDANRAFVQAFLARGTLTFPEAQELLAKIFTVQDGNRRATEPDDVTHADFDSFISAAAAALSPFDYAIRSTFHQRTHTRIWALINTTSDPLTQLATIRTADELGFIKRLLDLLFESKNTKRHEIMACTMMDAMKVAKAPPQSSQPRRESNGGDGEAVRPKDNSITQSHAEKLMEELVTENWLEKSANDFYTLSPRALMELRSWLVATYNDEDAEEGEWQRIKNCVACKEIVTVGQRCEDRDCNVRLHDVCGEGYWKTQQGGRRAGGSSQAAGKRCAGCGREWKGKSFVGERDVTTGEGWGQGRRKSKPGRSAPEEVVEQDGDDDDGEGEMEDGGGGEDDVDGDEEGDEEGDEDMDDE